ncbi:hypothetical protein ADUPG1_001033 [Aduncisulcus paluster]|uniref:Uncharacterized protein n=1 Tax=Aduncisulcus paluster TaxID=2918883 RepID=A0ABQ5K951_9EUKA|nr:hypothetical protein ADUPG1_001033 [Aduncisulcus paluster]
MPPAAKETFKKVSLDSSKIFIRASPPPAGPPEAEYTQTELSVNISSILKNIFPEPLGPVSENLTDKLAASFFRLTQPDWPICVRPAKLPAGWLPRWITMPRLRKKS